MAAVFSKHLSTHTHTHTHTHLSLFSTVQTFTAHNLCWCIQVKLWHVRKHIKTDHLTIKHFKIKLIILIIIDFPSLIHWLISSEVSLCGCSGPLLLEPTVNPPRRRHRLHRSEPEAPSVFSTVCVAETNQTRVRIEWVEQRQQPLHQQGGRAKRRGQQQNKQNKAGASGKKQLSDSTFTTTQCSFIRYERCRLLDWMHHRVITCVWMCLCICVYWLTLLY